MTTRSEISQWFDEGVAKGATHMIVCCDTFDWDDYPTYVHTGENVRNAEKMHNGRPMTKVMEVYNLRADKAEQLAKRRNFNYD